MTEEFFEDISRGNSSRNEIRSKISEMSSEDLQRLKEEIKAKVYDEDNSSGRSNTNISPKSTLKRENKNRPREMSSKIPPQAAGHKSALKYTQSTSRDPRFDPLCGTFDENIFKKSYKFIDDLKEKERKQLKEQLDEVTDDKERKKMKYVIQRLDNQIREKEKKDKAEDSNTGKTKKDKNTRYQRKSERKMMELINQYEDLKKSKKLEKYIKKKSRKLSKNNLTDN